MVNIILKKVISLKDLEEIGVMCGDLIEIDYNGTDQSGLPKRKLHIKGILCNVFEQQHLLNKGTGDIEYITHWIQICTGGQMEEFIQIDRIYKNSFIKYDDNDALLFKIENNIN